MTQDAERNYPLLCWWVAATAREVTTKPISRWLLEQHVVLFRTEGGEIAALEDRCPHRWAPLSRGRVVGDQIVCPYHGFRYNTRGACTLVPTQSRAPKTLQVRSYPVCERGGFVWIWMGDPERADPSLLPHIPWFDDPAQCKWQRYFGEVGCNYMLIQENVLDLTHITHLHADSLRQDDAPSPIPLPEQVKVGDQTVTFYLAFSDAPLAPFEGVAMGIEAGTRGNNRLSGTFASPACHVQESVTEVPNAQADPKSYHFYGLHCMTPITPRRSHYWQAHAQDYGHGLVNFVEYTNSWTEPVVKEDVEILEAIQESIDDGTHSDSAAEFLVASDRAVVEARRILKRMLDQERR